MSEPVSIRFRRGPDRRLASRPGGADAVVERRQRSIGWITLFRDVDTGQLEEALAECEVLALPVGSVLLRRGEANRYLFILLSGRLEAQLGDEGSAETAIDLGPGECIGELSAIDGKSISALVVALTDVRVLKVDRDVFWNRLMRLPGVAQNLMGTLTERMRRANAKSLALQKEQLELKHLRKELEVARQLQASMLPLQRPLFPGRGDVEVCGLMQPTSKVGGDFFDVFFVDARTLFFCIGDVSGHGIAAALFMARVIGLLRILAVDTTLPEKVLEQLNDRLFANNATNLFVTLLCGYIDVPSGRLVYSNAGHCAPMLCGDGTATLLPIPKGVMAGVASGRRYSSMERILPVGETLFCYTDGVTEAENSSGEPFSNKGCMAALGAGAGAPLPNLLDGLYETVIGHCGTRLLADDCTMLAVRRATTTD